VKKGTGTQKNVKESMQRKGDTKTSKTKERKNKVSYTENNNNNNNTNKLIDWMRRNNKLNNG